MAEVLLCSCLHCDWHFGLADLLEHELEYVFDVFETERITQDLSEQNLRHITKQNLVFAHQSFENKLIYLIVGTPVIANNVISDCLNELFVKVIVGSLILEIRVRVCHQTLRVINLHVGVICSEHVECEQVNNAFFP